MRSLTAAGAALALLIASPAPVPAQAPAAAEPAAQANDNAPGAPRSERPGRPAPQGERDTREGRRLPPDSVTRHVLELPGRTLSFTATAGSLPLQDPEGKLQAEIGYVAYTLDGAEPASRPVAFAVNGGPGASSVYLHLGAIGPWRLPFDGPTISPSAAPALVPNAETWLDFTDLVFIDPVGTGYSRATGSGEDVRNRFYTVEGDVSSLAAVIVRWLKARERLASPKFFVGESYGGFRGPLVTERLRSTAGLSGLVLVSPVLDFASISGRRWTPSVHAGRLPSYAAAAIEARGGALTREALAEAERYAAGEYLLDLTRGVQDGPATERVVDRVGRLTGLDPDFLRRYAGRVDPGGFQREFKRSAGRVTSVYEAGVTSQDPDPTTPAERVEDPVLSTLTAPLASAILDHLSRRLNWRHDGRYEVLNGSVNGNWRWGSGREPPESVNELRRELALDPNLRVLIVHGYTDLVTPYFATKLILDQLPAYGPDKRLDLAVYPGGHMFYSRAASRAAFRDDARRLVEAAAKARSGGPVRDERDRVGPVQ